MNESAHIKKWLDFLAEAETRLHISEGILLEKDQQTQDILHRLELYDDPYLERKKLYDLIPYIRRDRRESKDSIEVLTPIVQYIESNRKTISCLQQLLGEVRKAERKQRERIYSNRTNIVKDTLGHE